MKAFQEYLRIHMNIYSNTCVNTNTVIDENEFSWVSRCAIDMNTNSYTIYRFPETYTKALKSNVKIPRVLTQSYGYCIEDRCVKIYLRKGFKPIDTTLITLLQCHSYALFIRTQLLNNNGSALVYMEDRCINDGMYFTVQSLKEDNTATYRFKGIFTKASIGQMRITQWKINAVDMTIDERCIYSNDVVSTGETVSECIVRAESYGRRQCVCIDIYIGTDSTYDIGKQHNQNIIRIRHEAEHKGLNMLIQAGSAIAL